MICDPKFIALVMITFVWEVKMLEIELAFVRYILSVSTDEDLKSAICGKETGSLGLWRAVHPPRRDNLPRRAATISSDHVG